MVDQTPLPLLFMRTVIQAIDAFPSLVDFVMEILSKLVSKQVWLSACSFPYVEYVYLVASQAVILIVSTTDVTMFRATHYNRSTIDGDHLVHGDTILE
ncbi:hypothetical protein RHMOL_Rhmol03G0242000 [Rhododendron molle]|uniref:Uncharacterized protein n=4 Tax=Rhododendron molle TaxID=49168 RepID=A0ACC0PJ65_RHOML|nr:hypothetical protein RHMOL_Rhmol03G0242000 [Rhododendron molle]KAI8565199.1 hypothetical protein RHMOL_Rhmol03G0242000 [Rhododendron molle]KAI8565200.1 hypothetical protein RHMOL_Rhmol03G0242000 [Rhododendron molle]KAI8565201.1 hypothetical protein RHMOL_Rhmol03G0242000 [Rhododendron molle]